MKRLSWEVSDFAVARRHWSHALAITRAEQARDIGWAHPRSRLEPQGDYERLKVMLRFPRLDLRPPPVIAQTHSRNPKTAKLLNMLQK